MLGSLKMCLWLKFSRFSRERPDSLHSDSGSDSMMPFKILDQTIFSHFTWEHLKMFVISNESRFFSSFQFTNFVTYKLKNGILIQQTFLNSQRACKFSKRRTRRSELSLRPPILSLKHFGIFASNFWSFEQRGSSKRNFFLFIDQKSANHFRT